MANKYTKVTLNLKKYNSHWFGHKSFLMGTFFLASALPISGFFFIFPIFISFLNNKSNPFKDKWNYPLFFSSNLNDYNNHKRNIDFIKIPIDLIDLENFIEKNITNKEESIKEFYEINKNDYMTDEKRDIKYILVNNKEFIDNFIPTNNEIYEYYNSNKKEFLLNELRTFYQFNFS